MNPIKIGIVDDNVEFCKLLQEFLLTQPRLKVVATFHNGCDIITALPSHEFDVLLLDLIMPQMDGFEVLQWLRENPLPHKPRVIIFSAFSQEDVARNAVTLGANYYILKPFDLKVLVKRIIEIASEPSTATCYNRDQNCIDHEVVLILNSLNIPEHFKGYTYLRQAIMLSIADPELINELTKRLYPLIAENNGTTKHRVERSMRFAIETAWNKGKLPFLHQLFGYCVDLQKGKPTNASFIAKISDKIRLERKAKVGLTG